MIYNSAGPTDTDGDGVTDADEATDGTDETDLCDFVLASQTVTPSATWDATDCDFDGVSNADEVIAGTDPLVTIEELINDGINVFVEENAIVFNATSPLNGNYAIYNTLGQMMQTGAVEETVEFNATTGLYFVHLVTETRTYKFEIYKK